MIIVDIYKLMKLIVNNEACKHQGRTKEKRTVSTFEFYIYTYVKDNMLGVFLFIFLLKNDNNKLMSCLNGKKTNYCSFIVLFIFR
jgi:hypothetical protein